MSLRPLGSILLALLAGCHSLRSKVPIDEVSTGVSPRDQYQVWSGGASQVLIALRATPDSLTGVPYWKPPACDSCRVAMPRTAVDSIRRAGFDPNKTMVLVMILAPLAFVVYAFRGMGDSNY